MAICDIENPDRRTRPSLLLACLLIERFWSVADVMLQETGEPRTQHHCEAGLEITTCGPPILWSMRVVVSEFLDFCMSIILESAHLPSVNGIRSGVQRSRENQLVPMLLHLCLTER